MRIINVSIKCDDTCSIHLPNDKYIRGGVPTGMGLGGGGYMTLDINADTGQILGWTEAVKQRIVELERREQTDHYERIT